ncbi:MAG: PD-(D/E)XK nuclease domain-containing protein [Candidatus Sericytochromatia bacterium]|nr:PD-(D/E)XK nuclease domain-containing protein [Candidatus Sericytochromatia bacterium]
MYCSHLAAMGLAAQLEDATNKGRIDLALRVEEPVYLFDFKVV